jgi:hypothetical protein
VRLARRLPALGWEPVVLTIDEAEAYAVPRGTDASLVPPDVEVHRVSALWPTVRLERALLKATRWIPKAQKVVQVLARDGRLPDQFAEWTLAAIRTARRLGHFDAVWVTGAPFGMFVPGIAVGRALKRPVVLDYRDPWTPDLPPRTHPFGVPKSVRVALEKTLLHRAAGAIFVWDAMRDRYLEGFGQPAGATWAVIPNGFDPLDTPDVAPVQNDRPVLLYAGNCYGSRSMLPTLKALAEGFGPGNSGLLLRMFGTLDPAAADFLKAHPLPGRVEVHGRIPSADVVAQMRGAAGLLLIIGESHKTAISAKIFDYLMAERPILGTGPQGATAADLLRTCQVGRWVDTPAELIDALKQVEAGTLPFSPQADAIAVYSADRMAEATARVLSAVSM